METNVGDFEKIIMRVNEWDVERTAGLNTVLVNWWYQQFE